MAALCSLAALSTLALLPVSASVTRIVERAGRPLLLFDSLFGKKEAAPDEDGLALAQKLGLQLPQFEVLAKQDGFEVRRYQRLAVVECEYEKRPEGYELLGGYCAGETEAGLPMPKTAPCVMRPTAKPKTMWYILPNPHTPLDPEDEPVPPPVRAYSDARDGLKRAIGTSHSQTHLASRAPLTGADLLGSHPPRHSAACCGSRSLFWCVQAQRHSLDTLNLSCAPVHD